MATRFSARRAFLNAVDNGSYALTKITLPLIYGDIHSLFQALITATKHGDRHIARLLLGAGAPPNAYNEDGYTPLHIAILHGHWPICKLLIGKGADVNCGRRGTLDTPLHLIAGHHTKHLSDFFRTVVAKRLIDMGADYDRRNQDLCTPLHSTVCDPYRRKCYSNKAVAEILIEAGASLTFQDRHGETPLERAKQHNVPALIKLLEIASEEM